MRLAGVVAGAVVTLAAIDFVVGKLSPPVHRREVEDAVADLRRMDPDVLVLGSSHARTFHVLGEHLARATSGDQTLVAVPLEFGKLTGYDWVLEHRLQPLADERRDGARVRPSLSRFVLLTEWWDSCPVENGARASNLPSRAWAFGDFLADVGQHGITDYNRNYLRARFARLLRPMALVQYRAGFSDPVGALRERLRPTGAEEARARYDRQVAQWQGMIAGGNRCVGNAEQLGALGRVLDWARARGLETTIVLFPRKPATITPLARETTFARFAAMVRAEAAPRGARVVDLSWSTPLTDDDFMADFDHVDAEGNERFAKWALANDLAFLLEPAKARVTP